MGTSAWNCSISGHKRWLLIPPDEHLTKKFVRGKHLIQPGEDDEASNYFHYILPRLKKTEGTRIKFIEGIQYPGDTIFVPGNWWHAVYNLDDTVAITQNYLNEANFPKVWPRLRKGRKKLSVLFLEKLRLFKPHLYAQATARNERDGFVMWDKRPQYRKYDEGGEKNAETGNSFFNFFI